MMLSKSQVMRIQLLISGRIYYLGVYFLLIVIVRASHAPVDCLSTARRKTNAVYIQCIQLRSFFRRTAPYWHFSDLELWFLIEEDILRLLLSILLVDLQQIHLSSHLSFNVSLFQQSPLLHNKSALILTFSYYISLKLKRFPSSIVIQSIKIKMSRFRRLPRTAKDRHDVGVQYEPTEECLDMQTLTPNPPKSAVLPTETLRVGCLIKGMQKADQEGRILRQALKNKKKQEKKKESMDPRLLIKKLRDDHFQLNHNVYNITVGQIIDREAYLSKLSNQITELKTQIKILEGHQDQHFSKTIVVEKAPSSALSDSRTIEERKSLCGKIYSRANTPFSERRYGKFKSKQPETSSYYKWRPEVDEDRPQKESKQLQRSLQKQFCQDFNRLNMSERNKIESGRSFTNYRVKSKTSRRIQDKNYDLKVNDMLKNQKQLQFSRSNQFKADELSSSKTKTQNNPETELKHQNSKKGPQSQAEEQTQHQSIIQNGEEKRPESESEPEFLQPYSGIIFQQPSLYSISNINDDFRALITQQLQIPPDFPFVTPEYGLTIGEYEKIGEKTFTSFRANPKREPNKMITRRFKNGVYYHFGQGKTILWYFSGSFYLGGWDSNLPTEGQKNGFGFEYIPGKYIYLGEFKDGIKHGKGSIKIFSTNPESPEQFMAYEGEWSQGKPNGYGKHIDEKNNKYIGNFLAGEKTGNAIILTKQGLLYEGEVIKNIKNGYGVEKLVNGDSYMGCFEDGKFQGKGIYKWKNGNTYEGEFVKGKRQGMGKFVSTNGDQFQGQYFDDVKNGWGKFTWTNGQIYEGQFKNDIRHGEGTYRHPSGKVGKFMWKQGQIEHRLYSKQEEEYRCRNLQSESESSLE